MATLGEKIRAARLDQKLTQQQLAGRDFTKSYISELERGARTPRLTTLKILARRLDRPLSEFLSGVPGDQEPEAFLTIGLAELRAGALREAQASLARGLDLAAQQGDEVVQARLDLAIAMVERQLGHVSQASRRVDRCLRTLSHTIHWSVLARAQACLGQIRLDAGDTVSAQWAFEAALHLVEHRPDDPGFVADLHLYLAEAHRRLGQTQEADDNLRRALAAAEPFRDPHRIGAHYLERASSAVERGRFDEAVEHAGRASVVYESIAHKRRLAEIHRRLGEADLHGGRWEDAQRHYWWSVALHGAIANWHGSAQILGALVEAMLARASPESARALGETALALLTDGGPPGERADVCRLRGTICHLLGRIADARAALEESLRLFMEQGRPHAAGLVRQELALLAIEAQDLAGAERHLKLLRAGARTPGFVGL